MDVTPGFYYWNGSQWNRFSTTSGNTSTITGATNGLSVSGNDAILGGTLNSATTIATTNSNTLALQGLSTGNITSDELVSINPTTGVLTKVTIPSVTGQQTEVIYLASNGQAQFSTPAPYSSLNEISAYRNGVKIGLTAIDPNTIQLETGVTCFSNDEVRIVQNN